MVELDLNATFSVDESKKCGFGVKACFLNYNFSNFILCCVFFFFFYFFMQLYLWLYTVYFYCLITYQSWTAQTEQHETFFNCKCYFLIFITPDQAVQQKCQLEG